tara:strand:- start:2067 stop:2279 length:213 start_codon:yes stop_codon:yes gene_type:complete
VLLIVGLHKLRLVCGSIRKLIMFRHGLLKKLGLKVLADEENWKTKYPHVNLKIDELEAKVNKLEKGDKYD